MTALVDFVEVNKVAVGSLDPAPGRPPQLAGEDGKCRRNGDLPLIGDARVLPVEPCSGGAGVGDPVQGDVVENLVPSQLALRMSCKGVCDLFVRMRIVIHQPGGETHWRLSETVADRLRAR